MTDTDPNDPNADLPPASPIAVDAQGDPARQGSLMNEAQSYERVVDGLMIMAEAAAHMAQRDVNTREKLLKVAATLDVVRVTAVLRARIADKMRQRETNMTPNPPMAWTVARKRFRDGARQAAGGFRQLATCHRGEILWTTMAIEVERLAHNVIRPAIARPDPPRLILPDHVTRQ